MAVNFTAAMDPTMGKESLNDLLNGQTTGLKDVAAMSAQQPTQFDTPIELAKSIADSTPVNAHSSGFTNLLNGAAKGAAIGLSGQRNKAISERQQKVIDATNYLNQIRSQAIDRTQKSQLMNQNIAGVQTSLSAYLTNADTLNPQEKTFALQNIFNYVGRGQDDKMFVVGPVDGQPNMVTVQDSSGNKQTVDLMSYFSKDNPNYGDVIAKYTVGGAIEQAKARGEVQLQSAQTAKANADVANAPLERQKLQSEISKNQSETNQNNMFSNVQDSNGGLTGEALLAQLQKQNPMVAATVQKIGEGDQPMPPATTRNGKINPIGGLVNLVYPGQSAADFSAKKATKIAFSTGLPATNVTAIKTAIGHLNNLSDDADKLGNSNAPLVGHIVNAVKNTIASGGNAPQLKLVNEDAKAVGHEVAKAFKGPGATGEQQAKEWEDIYSASNTPDEKNAAIAGAVKLLTSRLEALADQHSQGMKRTTDPLDLISKHDLDILHRLQTKAGLPLSTPMSQNDAAPATAAAPAAPAAQTIVNPTTGQRMTLKDGQWTPLQ